MEGWTLRLLHLWLLPSVIVVVLLLPPRYVDLTLLPLYIFDLPTRTNHLICSFIAVVLAQILYRLRMDWQATPTSREKAEETFFVVVGIFVGWLVLRNIIIPAMSTGPPENNVSMAFLSLVLDLTFLLYLMITGIRARRFIRNKYAIPEQCCGECEDCCCIFWCKCCTLAQMARHTADYDTYAARCCTKSGLPPHVPEIV